MSVADVLGNRRSWHVECGDALAVLRTLPAGCVHCCVTSPPYFQLRDYQIAGQVGLEATVGEYVARLVEVFEEVRRVLRPDATCWANVGDSYATRGGTSCREEGRAGFGDGGRQRNGQPAGHKHKDLLGVPWTLAFALRDAGWYLRAECIWHKPAPMPESVTDRPTKAHEQVFLLSKRPRYYYDADAVRQPAVRPGAVGTIGKRLKGQGDFAPGDPQFRNGSEQHGRTFASGEGGANLRSVWTLAPRPFSDWSKTVRRVRAEAGAVGGDTERIASADCPVHGGRSVPAPTASDGGRGGGLLPRNPDTASRPAPERRAGSEPTDSPPGRCSADGSSGSPRPGCESPATASSSRSRRTAPAPATNPPCTLFGQTAGGTDGTPDEPASSAPGRGSGASSSGPAGSPGGPSPETPAGTAGTEPESASTASVESLRAMGCTCSFYRTIVEKTSHFATFPPELPARCVRAGTSERGVCPSCAAPWRRVVEKEAASARGGRGADGTSAARATQWHADRDLHNGADWYANAGSVRTVGWEPSCPCPPAEPVPALVLDPFCGAGTTLLVARRLGRRALGAELNPAYCDMARRRVEQDAPLFNAAAGE